MLTPLLAFILAAMTLLQPGVNHDKLARATANVVASEPALFLDDDSRFHTAAIDIAIMFRESSFRHGLTSRTGDSCEMQVHNRPDLLDDREKCIREGMRMIRASFLACPSAPLATYIGGGCFNRRARRLSDDRINLAARLLAETGAR